MAERRVWQTTLFSLSISITTRYLKEVLILARCAPPNCTILGPTKIRGNSSPYGVISSKCFFQSTSSSLKIVYYIVRFFFLSLDFTPRYSLKTARALPGELLGKLVKWALRTHNKRLSKSKLLQVNRLVTERMASVNLNRTPYSTCIFGLV